MGFAMSLFDATEWFVLILWFVAILAPRLYAARTRTSIAMGITVSVLLGSVVQVLWSMLYGWGMVEYWVWSDFVLVPARTGEPSFWHTLATAGFLHSQGDLMHVLGNVIILALVGVPLEQRLGARRYATVYIVGLFGGSWLGGVQRLILHPCAGRLRGGLRFARRLPRWMAKGRNSVSIVADSAVARGVHRFALLWFGVGSSAGDHGIRCLKRHRSHGPHRGFIAAYALLPLVARGGLLNLESWTADQVRDAHAAQRRRMKASMVDLKSVDDPWTARGRTFRNT